MVGDPVADGAQHGGPAGLLEDFMTHTLEDLHGDALRGEGVRIEPRLQGQVPSTKGQLGG